jgi:NADH dehydrogenase
MGNPRVVIIGGGFGGLNAAQALKNAEVQILLIDKANHHTFQPLLYQVATAALSPGNISSPIRDILAQQNNVTVLLANIANIDKEQKEVIAENGERFQYDYLIMAPGARHSYFGHPEWEEIAPGLKTLHDALRIRERILLSYERAERCSSKLEAARFMRFVIIGGGPTGVEMAGAIAEIAHKTLVQNFRHIKPQQTKVFLIEGMNRVLPTFPEELAATAKRDLEKLGVEVLLNSFVTHMSPEGVWIGDEFIESPNVIWAAGNQASPLLNSLSVPLDKCGRVLVQDDMSIPNHSDIFVIGDAACKMDKNEKVLPGIAPVAIQQGRYVAKLIKKKTPPQERRPFQYFDKGMMATIGKAKAIAVVGKVKISGYFAWLAWCFIHILYLISFSNRLLVMIEWFYLYLFNQRRIRLITRPISDQDDPIK